jgi:hypothetical protein
MFDRKKIKLKSLVERKHDLDLSVIKQLTPSDSINPSLVEELRQAAEKITLARNNKNSIILIIGAHVIRSGVQNHIIDWMKNGYINCLAMSGAGAIHDFELALIGATTENVVQYIKKGEFGMWKETGRLNDIVNEGYRRYKGCGMGEAIGKAIEEENFPNKNISLLASAYRLNIPATIHVGIGQDIIHQLPNCDGAATGALSYNDFLKITSAVENLENGVVMNFGSSVMGPEVYLKALSMARNVATQGGKEIKNFFSLVCDLYDLPKDLQAEPPKTSPEYHLRFWKTMLVRTICDGGVGCYVKGRHADTIPALWTAIKKLE